MTPRARSAVAARAPSVVRSPSTTPPSSSPASRAAALGVFEATRFATGRKNAIRIEINGSRGSLAFDFEDMNVLEFFDAAEPSRDRRLPPDPRHRAGAPLRRPPGGRPATGSATSTASPTRSSTWSARSPTAPTRLRRSPTACRSSGCWPPSRPAPTPAPGRRSPHDPTDHAVHRPVGRPAVRGGGAARLRSGATTASRSPAGATTSTRGRADDDGYVQGKLDLLEKYGLQALRDLQPPQGPGGLRRPDRRPAPGDPVLAGLGRR